MYTLIMLQQNSLILKYLNKDQEQKYFSKFVEGFASTL